jgi:DNA-binding MarR family transcriptional regulator/N-acetylglutamate synthase-like GNAT family acetyltransferase
MCPCIVDIVNELLDDVNHMAQSERVAAVRSFNRFYTSRLGMVRSGLHRTEHPLAEARVLYEAGQGTVEVAALRHQLKIDAGHLSRLLTKLEGAGLLTRERSAMDARRQRVRLTLKGQAAFHRLDHRSAAEVHDLLDGLPEDAQRRLVRAMDEIAAVLQGVPPAVVIRGARPGDLGWLVERHGALYAEEYAWDASFERLVARIVADFDPEQDAAWIAEYAGARAGCVLCVHKDESTAMLRTLLVEPHARGTGLGARLVDEVIRHARVKNYERLTLWTNDVLTAARRIYERAGFTLDHEAPHHAFGHDLVEQTWSLNLTTWTETS